MLCQEKNGTRLPTRPAAARASPPALLESIRALGVATLDEKSFAKLVGNH